MAIKIALSMPADAVERLRQRLADGSPETEQFKRELGIISVEFPPEQIVIDEATGEVTMIDSELTRAIAADLGETRVTRASHVEPDNRVLCTLFHLIRTHVADDSRLAAWTRTWRCLWRVRLSSEVDAFGTILPGRWRSRKAAIQAEVEYLNRLFAR